jgi:curved DNA-binding protein CbpA
MVNYYRVLDIHPEATDAEIKRAYRRLALRWHPDRNPGDPEATERFKQISEAYAVLIDPEKRRAYDRARRGGLPGDFAPRRDELFRDLFADPRASAIFEELAREFERRGLRVDAQYFRQTLFGGRAVVTGGIVVVSPFAPLTLLFQLVRAALRGAATPARDAPRLPAPGGVLARVIAAGRRWLGLPRPVAEAGPLDVVFPLRLTRAEAAQGGRKRLTLNRREGPDEVVVTIPPGVRAGTRLRLRGKGRTAAGQPPGDAYLVVEIV